jgi:peptide/nickel transport system permease protein
MSYFYRRSRHALLLLFGVSILSFLFTTLAPGNYFDQLRLNPQVAATTVVALRAEREFGRPLVVRYGGWLVSTMRGEMGFSLAYRVPVAPLLWVHARNTLRLTIVAMLLAWGLALPLGIWSAARSGQIPDRAISSSIVTLMVVPDLCLALGLLLIAERTGWFPTGGMISPHFDRFSAYGKAVDVVSHTALPVTALILSTLPTLVRHVRASMVEAINAPSVKSARGLGVPRARLLCVYALPSAAGPLVSLFGLSIGALLSGSLVVEIVMSWPGIGPLLLESILARDLYVVIGAVMFSTLFLVAGNFVADVLLFVVDPRIRGERSVS